MLAGIRRMQPDRLGETGNIDRRRNDFLVADIRAVHFRRHAEMFHLRIGEHLVDRVDRAARNAVRLEQFDPVLRRFGRGDLADRAR